MTSASVNFDHFCAISPRMPALLAGPELACVFSAMGISKKD
jgi:hypothetical protein